MIKTLKHYRKYDVTLHDDQSNELLRLVSAISDKVLNELYQTLYLQTANMQPNSN